MRKRSVPFFVWDFSLLVHDQDMMKKRRVDKWSGRVTMTSNALDLESGVFTFKDPAKIARSLKRSAEESARRRTTPFASAMSMLNFYINRAGKNLGPAQLKVLEAAKVELRKAFHRI